MFKYFSIQQYMISVVCMCVFHCALIDEDFFFVWLYRSWLRGENTHSDWLRKFSAPGVCLTNCLQNVCVSERIL